MGELRRCRDCGHSDFASLLDKYSVRAYRHAARWSKRCGWFKANPRASLADAKAANLPGVSFEEDG